MNINEPSRGGGFTLPFIKNASQKRREKGEATSSLKSNRIPFLNFMGDEVRFLCIML
jgi:hypothetical protein